MEACELLDAELALDQLEAGLAIELPIHLRAVARAYAAGSPLPPAPASVRRSHALATARRALVHPELADRAVDLLRILAPTAIESAIGPPREATWEALRHRATAANTIARATWGYDFIELMHRLHGSAALHADPMHPATDPIRTFADPTRAAADATRAVDVAAVEGWRDGDGIEVTVEDVRALFRALAARHGVEGSVTFVPSTTARPRTFLVEPGREIAVVIPPRIATPQQRWATAHELGHAIAGCAARRVWPRVVDEGAAAYTARAIEHTDGPLGVWYSALAREARARRNAYTRRLDAIERGFARAAASSRDGSDSMREGRGSPPRALFDDPGAQAAYIAAEDVADALERELGPAPPPGAFASALERWRVRIDSATRL